MEELLMLVRSVLPGALCVIVPLLCGGAVLLIDVYDSRW